MAKHIEDQFKQFDSSNPHVYETFKRFAYEVLDSGRKKYSANGIFERMRWHTEIETRGDPFKLSNNYRAYYARKLMDEFPEFSEFFKTKKLAE